MRCRRPKRSMWIFKSMLIVWLAFLQLMGSAGVRMSDCLRVLFCVSKALTWESSPVLHHIMI